MSADLQQYQIAPGVTLHRLTDARFKTSRLSFNLLVPLAEDTASAYALVPYLLTKACQPYPDFTRLHQRLSDLYGAELSARAFKMGEAQVLAMAIEVIDDSLTLDGHPVSGQAAQLLCDMLLRPCTGPNGFDDELFANEKRCLVELIESEINDKRPYSINRCIAAMCKGEAFATGRLGSLESAQKLENAQAFQAWNTLLRQARLELWLVGPSDPAPVLDCVRTNFTGLERAPGQPIQTQVVRRAEKTREVTERLPVKQGKLVLGMRAGVAAPDEEEFATRLMTVLYGASPTSMLFSNVREKLSLCYYCAANYDKTKGILMVDSGVEFPNMDKARDEILRQLDLVRAGSFSDEDLEAARLYLQNVYRTTSDSLAGIELYYLSSLSGSAVRTPEEAAALVGTLTRQQVVDAAKKVTLDTIYYLKGQE